MKIYFDGTTVKPDLKYIFVFRFAEAYVGLAISAEKNEEGKKLIVVRQSREKKYRKTKNVAFFIGVHKRVAPQNSQTKSHYS